MMNEMIGTTTSKTWHGDYGTSFQLPAGTRVRLEPSGESAPSPVKWRAYQISGPKWRVLGGVYLRDTEVKIDDRDELNLECSHTLDPSEWIIRKENGDFIT